MTLDDFLAKWSGTLGGGERGNYQMFLTEFCQAMGLPVPNPKVHTGIGDYEFDAVIPSDAAFGDKTPRFIDLYKRRHFVLEAKQSKAKDVPDPVPVAAPPPVVVYDLLGHPIATHPAPRAKATRVYDRLMEGALAQAKGYALALPADHGWPPFLIVCDVGRAFEIFFDWAGNGKGYAPFPDAKSYRIDLADLARRDVAARLHGIWTDPDSIDPRRQAVRVTREIALRLAGVSKALERWQRTAHPGVGEAYVATQIEDTALFLMRLLFCMFAEDVGLLPENKFRDFLADAVDKSETNWRRGLEDLWRRMNTPDPGDRWWSFGDTIVRYFNGNLFAETKTFDLGRAERGELLAAAKCDWRAVEPAIFGTLLEQVLTDTERAALGAHYTPRAYVERLVEATIMDVLRPEWEAIRAAEPPDVAAVTAFHARLVATRVLDPACGTGNFLYVAMEALLRLEGDVLILLAQLGQPSTPAVRPNQFLGLEKNPRAAVITELVLWIGWLRFRLANTPDAIRDPVLPTLDNINFGRHLGYDAVLALTPAGEPEMPPRAPDWPAADFIVGNPPFIGAKYLRGRLGGAYAEALWRASPAVPPSADFVMHWWDRAAQILTTPGTRLRRFGFVTTNSITQVFSRRVVAARLAGEVPLSLVLAIADHPWYRPTREEADKRRALKRSGEKAKGPAAVRIAMTVAEAGRRDGTGVTITREAGLDTDTPQLDEVRTIGRINADLSIGTDVTAVRPLRANDGICSPGVKLHGAGFIVTPAEAAALGLGTRAGLDAHIRPYRNGRDLLQRSRGVLVIDLFGLSEKEVRERYPEVWSHLRTTVWQSVDKKTGKPNGRSVNSRESYKKLWWIFGEPRRELRPALIDLDRYIVTVDTAAHRVFQYLPTEVICDDKSVVIALSSSYALGVLSSRLHVEWSIRLGGWLGVGNDSVYVKSLVFDPFPFPDATPAQRATIATIADDLDATRRAVLGEVPALTMTGLYNLVAAVRAGATGPDDESAVRRARARIVAKLHDDLDAAVAAAYGWGAEWAQAPLPPAEIVARLVALNAERAGEEAAGHIRWLRPDYQAPAHTP